MCGITGIIKLNNTIVTESGDNIDNGNLFTELYEALFHLQHRGQDSVGIGLFENESKCNLIRKLGLIHNLNQDFHNLNKNNAICGMGHIRYSTNNGINYDKLAQIQPIYKKIC